MGVQGDGLERVWMLLEAGRADQALTELHIRLGADPHDAQALQLLSECHQRRGEAQPAYAFTESIRLDPWGAHHFAHRALAHAARLDRRHAEADIARARDLRPHDAQIVSIHGQVLTILGRRTRRPGRRVIALGGVAAHLPWREAGRGVRSVAAGSVRRDRYLALSVSLAVLPHLVARGLLALPRAGAPFAIQLAVVLAVVVNVLHPFLVSRWQSEREE